jgi:hypothetical protein
MYKKGWKIEKEATFQWNGWGSAHSNRFIPVLIPECLILIVDIWAVDFVHIYIFFIGSLRGCNMLIWTILVEPITWKHAMTVCVGMVSPKWTNTHEGTIMDGWMNGWMDEYAWTQHFQIGWMDGAWTYMWKSQDSLS